MILVTENFSCRRAKFPVNPSRESGLPETLSGSAREAAMNKKQSYKNKIFRPLFGLWSQKHGQVRATFSSGCNPCGSVSFCSHI